jgi:hypothetical protein
MIRWWRGWWHRTGPPAEPERQEALAETEERLRAATRDSVEISKRAETLGRVARVNHLGPMIADALRAPRTER